MKLSRSVKSISYVKAHASELLDEISEGGVVVITQNGEARAVLQDMVEYERNQESLALLKLLALGTKDVEQGRLIPARRAFAGLRRRLKNGPGL